MLFRPTNFLMRKKLFILDKRDKILKACKCEKNCGEEIFVISPCARPAKALISFD